MNRAGALKGTRKRDAARLSELDRSTGTLITLALCGLALALGWRSREELWITPDEGLGYALGIGGLAAMASLLLYSLRKRVAFMRGWAPLPLWFATHMVLGIVGPTAILFHANFQVRSMNARVALIAMLTVAGSGLFGRFIYTRVHRGLYGERQTLRELTELAAESRALLHASLAGFAAAEERVRAFERVALAPAANPIALVARALLNGPRAWLAFRSARALLRAARADASERWLPEAEELLRAHLGSVRRAAAFALWERVFGVWHALHFPLAVALFVAAAIHVVAVHVY